MGCNCGKPKCDGQCGCKSPAVLQINNPPEYITFHKVSVPAVMGDSTTNPPAVGKYKNVLLYYEADRTSWMYSTDGIPTKLTNGITNYEDAINLPQINGNTLIGNKTGEELGLQDKLAAGENIQISEENVISATDTTYTADDGIEVNSDNEISAKIGRGLEFNADGEIDVSTDYIIGFDTVVDMKSSENLVAGSFAKTTGFYSVNDGGGALYKIRNITNDDVIDNGSIISITADTTNTLIAELQVEKSSVSAKQFGVKIDDSTDDSVALQNAINYVHNNDSLTELLLNGGTYKISNTITVYNDVGLLIPNNVTFNTYTNDVAVRLIRNSVDDKYPTQWIRGNGQLKINNAIERSLSGIGVKMESNESSLDNIIISNLNIRNFKNNFKLIPLNIWNIKFSNCIFYNSEEGFKYQRDTLTQAQNSGERISFENCVFTQNISDVYINGRLISQMNFHNCSFDFSNCIFNIPYNSSSAYLNSLNKISVNQCHIEGICQNIEDLSSYTGAYGILYMDGSYDLTFSLVDSTWVVYKDATYFNSTSDARKNATINISNVYIFNDIDTPKHLFWSNRPAQMNINTDNISYRSEHAVINNHSGDRINSLPFANNTILNSNPLFENLSVGNYGTTLNTVIGDYKITEVSGISSIVCSTSNISSNSKKLTINFDPSFSQTWNAVLKLQSTKFTPVNHLKPLVLQALVNYIKNLPLTFNIVFYDAELNELTTFFDYGLRENNTDSNVSTTLGNYALYPPAGAAYCKFNYSILGKTSGNDVSRELEGLMLYNL